jgi:hypothetical protein
MYVDVRARSGQLTAWRVPLTKGLTTYSCVYIYISVEHVSQVEFGLISACMRSLFRRNRREQSEPCYEGFVE